MIGRTRIAKALTEALDAVDPNQAKYPEIKRKRITYPMCNFTHALKDAASEYKQIEGVSFQFPEEAIEKGQTTCVFKLAERIIRLTYDFHDDSVIAFCVGKNYEGAKDFKVSELVEEIRDFFPKDEPKKVVIRKKFIVRKPASLKPS